MQQRLFFREVQQAIFEDSNEPHLVSCAVEGSLSTITRQQGTLQKELRFMEDAYNALERKTTAGKMNRHIWALHYTNASELEERTRQFTNGDVAPKPFAAARPKVERPSTVDNAVRAAANDRSRVAATKVSRPSADALQMTPPRSRGSSPASKNVFTRLTSTSPKRSVSPAVAATTSPRSQPRAKSPSIEPASRSPPAKRVRAH
jgi:hypothetical protein